MKVKIVRIKQFLNIKIINLICEHLNSFFKKMQRSTKYTTEIRHNIKIKTY